MTLKVGEIVTGKVSGITGFGAFIDLGDHKNGLVHISEVSDGFIKDIHDVLNVGDDKVKVMKIGDDGKTGLSIRAPVINRKQMLNRIICINHKVVHTPTFLTT